MEVTKCRTDRHNWMLSIIPILFQGQQITIANPYCHHQLSQAFQNLTTMDPLCSEISPRNGVIYVHQFKIEPFQISQPDNLVDSDSHTAFVMTSTWKHILVISSDGKDVVTCYTLDDRGRHVTHFGRQKRRSMAALQAVSNRKDDDESDPVDPFPWDIKAFLNDKKADDVFPELKRREAFVQPHVPFNNLVPECLSIEALLCR